MATASKPITQIAQEWIALDRDPETRGTIAGLLAANNTAELEKRLRSRLAFGTAGLRSSMDAGFAHMNALTIIQTAIGLAHYITRQHQQQSSGAPPSIVVGFDGRRNSARFAHLSCNIFVAAGFKVLLFPDIVPTPFVPFAVAKYGLTAGVMVTASHNPPNDNGYKVYWSTGAQIVSPQDEGIAAAIEECLVTRPARAEDWNSFGVEDKVAFNPTAEVHAAFFESMASVMLAGKPNSRNEAVAQTPIVYTAMHGVGTQFTLKAMRDTAGMASIHLVPEQCFPDPYFRTVDFPNPEEGKSALNLAIRTADAAATRSDIIVANDPDADRLAAAERRPAGAAAGGSSGWKVFSGNELGALFGNWLVESARQKRNNDLSHCAVLCSTVGSMILRSIANHPDNKGLYFEETLTGFKFMGTRTKELEAAVGADGKKNKDVIFAFEEAIGFMCGSRVRDKDGVTAAAVLCDMIRHYKASDPSWTLQKQLDLIYAKYGQHINNTSYVISSDPKQTMRMFEEIRNNGKYVATVGGIEVLSVRDLSPPGYDSTRPDKKPVLPLSTASPMVTMELANGVRCTVRASGTEPKIKYYTEIVAKPGEEREAAEKKLEATVEAIVKELVQPHKFGFAARSKM